MIRAILGTLGILVALGLAVYFLSSGRQAKEPASRPPAPTQVAVQPAPEPSRKPAAPAPPPPAAGQSAPPAPAGPPAPPAAAPAPAPRPPQIEEKFAPLPTLEPQKKPGLVVGKFHNYKDAQRLLDRIRKKNLPGFIRKDGKDYEVWAGPFATPQEAERTGKSLKTTLKLSPQPREYEVPVPK
jgi:type IV secretory pathway VirB10-like protein